MRCIIEAEEEAVTLAECDQRALERFQMLDAMEAEDQPISLARFEARLGALTPDEFKRVQETLIQVLHLGD